MSTLRMTPLQRGILGALSTTRELTNAQVAEAAGCCDGYASDILTTMERMGLATSRYAQDKSDPQTRYRLWKRKK